jgi:hypothetical protein
MSRWPMSRSRPGADHAESARWEQAMSSDLGKTWDTHRVMEFSRVE